MRRLTNFVADYLSTCEPMFRFIRKQRAIVAIFILIFCIFVHFLSPDYTVFISLPKHFIGHVFCNQLELFLSLFYYYYDYYDLFIYLFIYLLSLIV